MKNLLTIAYYELKRLFRNPRLMIIVLSQPIVIALIVGMIMYKEPQDIKVGLIVKEKNEYSDSISKELNKSDKLNIDSCEKINVDDVRSGKIRGYIELDIQEKNNSAKIKIYHDPTGRVLSGVIEKEVLESSEDTTKNFTFKQVNGKVDDFKKNISELTGGTIPKIEIKKKEINSLEIETEDVTDFDLQYFDYYASAMMVLLVLLVVINLSAMSITGERLSGTFERLFVTPYSKFEVIFGKMLAQILIGVFIAVLGVITLYLIFGISMGNIFLVMLINFLVVITSVTLGLLISSITYTVVESVELAMYVFFVSVLTAGILSPLETAYKYFPYFMKAIPFYYAVDTSRRINMLDAGWTHVSTNVYILVVFFIGFFMLSVLFLRREAK